MNKLLLLMFAILFILATSTQSMAVSSIKEVLTDKQQIIKHKNSEELNILMKLDVIGFFELKDVYNTELKLRNFFKSEEYKEKLEQLTKLRADTLNKKYYVRFRGGDTFGTDDVIRNYNIKKQGIPLKLQTDFVHFYQTNMLDGVLFKFLPTKANQWTNSAGFILIDDFLFVPMDEERGALIENNVKKIDVIFVFSFKDSFYVEADCPANLYLANRDTGEIYLEKTYQCMKPSKKKEAKKSKSKKKQ